MADQVSYIDDCLRAMLGWTGSSAAWMYQDVCRPFAVAVGAGEILPDVMAACSLPFEIQGRAATAKEIASDFLRVRGMKPGMTASYYRVASSVQLSTLAIVSRLEKRVQANAAALACEFTDFEAWPDACKIAALDMECFPGDGKPVREHPELDASLRFADWKMAAANCYRVGISDGRNTWTCRMFRSAAREDDHIGGFRDSFHRICEA